MTEYRPSSPYHVVIVDDDGDMLQTIAERFESAGFVIAVALSFRAALDLFDAERRVDLLVTDYNLGPTETGVLLAQEVRKSRPDLPVLIVTGDPDAAAQDPALVRALILSKRAAITSVVAVATGMLRGDA